MGIARFEAILQPLQDRDFVESLPPPLPQFVGIRQRIAVSMLENIKQARGIGSAQEPVPEGEENPAFLEALQSNSTFSQRRLYCSLLPISRSNLHIELNHPLDRLLAQLGVFLRVTRLNVSGEHRP